MTPAFASGIDLNLGDNRLQGMVELIANQKQFNSDDSNNSQLLLTIDDMCQGDD